jgi:hypothetical protein
VATRERPRRETEGAEQHEKRPDNIEQLLALGWVLGSARAKRPKGSHGHLSEPASPEGLRRAVERGEQVYVALEPSGLIDIDIDVRRNDNGHRTVDGFLTLERLEKQAGPLFAVCAYTSPQGGQHHLFKRPDDERLATLPEGHIGPGVEVKLHSATIPPSEGYEWLPRRSPWDWKPSALPDQWLALIIRERTKHRDASRNGSSNGRYQMPEHVAKEEQHEQLIRYLGQKITQGLSEEECLALAHEVNETNFEAPLPEHEIAYQVHHACSNFERGNNGKWKPRSPNGATRARAQNEAEAQDDLSSFSSFRSYDWPAPMGEAAYHGLTGRIVRKIEPETEADVHAVHFQFLAGAGNAMGRMPHIMVGADRHGTNLNLAVVGETASGRKGVSKGQAFRPVAAVDPVWAKDRQAGGLSSGEGVIYALRDPQSKTKIDKDGNERVEIVDEGVRDKRLMVVETEFARTLEASYREGNTLSTVLRQGWDGYTLQNLTKNSPLKASDPHLSVVAHITPADLLSKLRSADLANGFANRFLFVLVRRSRELPFGGAIDDVDFGREFEELRSALTWARFQVRKFGLDEDVRKRWPAVYSQLLRERPGPVGQLVARAPAHIRRIALIYAVLDKSRLIRWPHIEAALAVWRYAEHSAAILFGEATGNPLADELLDALRNAGSEGLSRTEIRDHFSRNRSADEIDEALRTLEESDSAYRETVSTAGRPIERWFAALRSYDKNDINDQRSAT